MIKADKWEPSEILPRSKILSAHRLKKLQPPNYIYKSVVGWNEWAKQNNISKQNFSRASFNSDLEETNPR